MNKIFITLLLIFSPLSYGKTKGDTYDDCIIQNLKGVTSDVAAVEIRKACRSKYPEEKVNLPSKSLYGVDAHSAFVNAELIKNYFGAGFFLSGTNTLEHSITGVTLSIKFNNLPEVTIRSEALVKPMSSGTFSIALNNKEANDLKSWSIKSVSYRE